MYHVDWSKDSKLRMVSFQGCVTAAEFQAFSKESTQVPARATFIDFSRIEEIGFGFGELSPHAAAVKSLYEDSQILPDEIVLAPKRRMALPASISHCSKISATCEFIAGSMRRRKIGEKSLGKGTPTAHAMI
jgi:hypothetical protein